METEDTEDFLALVDQLSTEYDARAQQRHTEGSEKYGPFKFLTADVVEEALQEILDFGNYMRYQYIKLRLLQLSLNEELEMRGDKSGEVTIGVDSFRQYGREPK